MSHTILLVQPTKSPQTRTYSDYETVPQAMQGVCSMFEDHLRRSFPDQPGFEYTVEDLGNFVDQLYDISCLVHHQGAYMPHGRDYIKQKVHAMLRGSA
eukprot:m.359702 g.359702  ORF g.359702 m.359702 type:complete len:98 (-) comp18685_c0_seq1:242-535(-)